MSTAPRLVSLGDAAMAIEFEERVDVDVNRRAVRLAEALAARSIPGVRDVVPTFRSVAVYFDPFDADAGVIGRWLQETSTDVAPGLSEPSPIEVPVRYGGDVGPDLALVAASARMGPSQVVALHAARTYRVFMLGFVPGFAYMGPLDPALAMPRRSAPRTRVPAGSVAIAEGQTGIYPLDTPGGWHIIGRTELAPFDVSRANPFLFKAGDMVRFVALGAS